MSDDSDLVRLFAQSNTVGQDEMFVVRVMSRIQTRERVALVAQLCAIALVLLVLIVLIVLPAQSQMGLAASQTIAIAQNVNVFVNSLTGMVLGGSLLLCGVLWTWLYEQTRGVIG